MSMLLEEGELLMWDFEIRKVSCAPFPIDRKDYEESRAGVQREIWRTESKMKRHYDPDALEELGARVNKLKAIIEDMNKILNA
jgi:hypothetical protein